MGRELSAPLGGGYVAFVQWVPYALRESEKEGMRTLFARVMAQLAFRATPQFVENLFDTSILVRVFTASGELAAFGNVRTREAGGVKVHHLFAVYVDPEHREMGLSVKAIETVLRAEAIANGFCLRRPLIVTGSAVNPMVVRSLGRRAELWPDLVGGRKAPEDVLSIARASAAYYPARGEFDFQVAITPEFAALDPGKDVQVTGDPEFDARFFSVARPEEYKLLLFVARIRFRDVMRSVSRSLSSRARSRLERVFESVRGGSPGVAVRAVARAKGEA